MHSPLSTPGNDILFLSSQKGLVILALTLFQRKRGLLKTTARKIIDKDRKHTQKSFTVLQ